MLTSAVCVNNFHPVLSSSTPQTSLVECNIQNIKREVVHTLVTVALEESASHRELASVLISDLYGSCVINSHDVTEGIDHIIMLIYCSHVIEEESTLNIVLVLWTL